MTGTRPARQDQDGLEGLLDQVLKDELPRGGVDVGGLVVSTRRRVRRTRIRRRVHLAVAATAFVALLPLAWSLRPGQGPALAQPATTTPTGSSSLVSVPVPTPSAATPSSSAAAPSSSGPTPARILANGVNLDSLALAPRDLGRPITLFLTEARVARPTPYGPCADAAIVGQEVAGGHWWWQSDDVAHPSFTVVVTVTWWRPGTAHATFAALVPGSGRCGIPFPAVATQNLGGDESWAVTWKTTDFPRQALQQKGNHLGPPGSVPTAMVAARHGNLIISVAVQDEAGGPAALTRARRALDLTATRAATAAAIGRP